jgi:hypothetical protein
MRSRKTFALLAFALIASLGLAVGTPHAQHSGDDVTRIHLTEKNGYFQAKETLMNLEPGTYVFEVTNEAGKMVGFQLQDLKTIEPGKTKEYEVEISSNGFRYRCPINPTPWYEVNVGGM